MPLSAGTKLGPYQILAPIGAGGMGEVYRAKDTKLKRDVALKVLPSAFANDPERMARFQREAEVLAALNHPNIAAIYGIEQHALVMEFVEGENLKGPLPIATALNYARQIAEALEAAHEKNIVHRDLKPPNVKITPAGVVKVLDFGLAKATEQPADSDGSSISSTLPLTFTSPEVVMGTPAYMSPEQAQGSGTDRRADIWSFGAVLYEMLTGKRAFPGKSVSDILVSVLKEEPDWSALPDQTPAPVRELLRRCLTKDRKRRLQAIGDARIAIEDVLSGASQESGTSVAASQSRGPWAAAAVVAVAAAGIAGYFLTRPAAPALTSQFTLEPPPDTNFTNEFAATAISPDGRFLVYGAAAGSAMPTLWLRPLDSLAVRSLPGTDGGNFPFWSPDSKSIAFFARGKLKRVDVVGGAPLVLCDAPVAGNLSVGGAWSRDGVILFGSPDGLRRVPASGGVPMLLTKADVARKESGHGYPQFLPDGKRFLYFIRSGDPNTQGVYAGSLDRPHDRVQILRTGAKGLYAPPVAGHPGYLLWLEGQTLLAQRFDAGNLRPEGDPAPLAENVARSPAQRAAFWTSDAGLLAYRTSQNFVKSKLVWIGRDGKHLGNAGPEDNYMSFQLSPDGKRVAIGRLDPTGNADIWLLEFGRGVFTRFTFDPKRNSWPVWSPDGRQIVFSSDRTGFFQLYRKDSAGVGQEEQLTNGPNNKYILDWSRDGRYLLYQEATPKTADDIMALPLEGERKPMVVLQTPFSEGGGVFSPDGKWIAYESDESGRDEVYLRAFSPAAPAAGGKWQVSNQGGGRPRWRGDGKELFYLVESNQSNRMMAVGIRMTATSVETDLPRELFPPSVEVGNYDVTPDGQRFLVEELLTTAAGPWPLTVVTNWQAGLK
jgi:serine/threonine protein kinase/Tol biopolymer transport system component